MPDETDDTVRLPRPRARPQPRRAWPLYAALAAVLACGGLGWWVLQPGRPQAVVEKPAILGVPVAPSVAPNVVTSVPAPALALPPLADEAQILAASPAELATYRFTPQPAIIVFQFPSLEAQAQMLNRVAALVEKSGFPRDAVLPRQQVDARIVAGGGTPATFYYGHDYPVSALQRFFALVGSPDGAEGALQAMMARYGWTEPGANGALISLVRLSGLPDLDEAARATILRHEISHGYFFTDPVYADYARRFWGDVMTAEERQRFTEFLGREGYDATVPDLMINETQAYLVFTQDPRFFSAAAVGIKPARLAELRQVFIVGMPPGWLRDSATADRL